VLIYWGQKGKTGLKVYKRKRHPDEKEKKKTARTENEIRASKNDGSDEGATKGAMREEEPSLDGSSGIAFRCQGSSWGKKIKRCITAAGSQRFK